VELKQVQNEFFEWHTQELAHISNLVVKETGLGGFVPADPKA